MFLFIWISILDSLGLMMSTRLPSIVVGWMRTFRPTFGKSAFDFLFGGHCVCVGGTQILCFFSCSMLVLQKPLRVERGMTRLYWMPPLVLFLVANNRIIGSEHPYSYSRIWEKSYSDPSHIRFVYSRITE